MIEYRERTGINTIKHDIKIWFDKDFSPFFYNHEIQNMIGMLGLKIPNII